jgi:hypothetical protein
MAQLRADGTSIPFEIADGHWWTHGVVLPAQSQPVLPQPSRAHASLRNIDRSIARAIANAGGGYIDEHSLSPKNRGSDNDAENRGSTRAPPPKNRGIRRRRSRRSLPTRLPRALAAVNPPPLVAARTRSQAKPAPPSKAPVKHVKPEDDEHVGSPDVSPSPGPPPAPGPHEISTAHWSSGIGCASYQLPPIFRSTCAFESDATASDTLRRSFPHLVVDTTFEKAMTSGSPFLAAASTAQVGFASPPSLVTMSPLCHA